jgi:hypothetical protein
MRRILLLTLLTLTLVGCNGGTLGLSTQQFAYTQTQNVGNPNVKVWVNTKTRVYHCPATRWYGNTREGEFMTQKQAQEKGYRPAYGKACE